MSTEEIMKEVGEKIYVMLQGFIGYPASRKTFYEIQAKATALLYEYYQAGHIDVMPLCDVNHLSEIEHLDNKIRKLQAAIRDENVLFDDVKYDLANMIAKRTTLEEAAPLTGLRVFLKNQLTFEPYVWPPMRRKQYDH